MGVSGVRNTVEMPGTPGKEEQETMKPSATFEKERELFIENYIRRAGISDERVIQAFRDVPRHEFVLPHLVDDAYRDLPLPIGRGQVITQPSLVATMTQALMLSGDEKVLEIGTGSGFQAAILARLSREVFTVERIGPLAHRAMETLKRLGCDNVRVLIGDGSLGLPPEAPFDAIMVTAGAPDLPKPLAEQLRKGGRLVIPVGTDLTTQILRRYVKRDGEVEGEDIEWVHFVPLIGRHGWPENPGHPF